MKVKVTYEETISYTHTMDVDDEELSVWAEGEELSGALVKDFLTSSDTWEEDLHAARTMRNSFVNYFDTEVFEVEILPEEEKA